MSANLNGSTDLDAVALAKVVSEEAYKAASAGLTVGKHEVDVTVRIVGTIGKGADYEQKVVAKADPWGLLAVALSKLNGVTVDSLTREALGLSEDALTAIKEQAKESIAAVKGPTLTKCNGKVTANLTATVKSSATNAA